MTIKECVEIENELVHRQVSTHVGGTEALADNRVSPAYLETESKLLLMKVGDERGTMIRAWEMKIKEELKKSRDERGAMVTLKLIEQLRPYVEAKNPGGKDDAATMEFVNKVKGQAEDLKMECFGIEVSLYLSNDSQTLNIVEAVAYYWEGVYNEDYVIHETQEAFWHVSCWPLLLNSC